MLSDERRSAGFPAGRSAGFQPASVSRQHRFPYNFGVTPQQRILSVGHKYVNRRRLAIFVGLVGCALAAGAWFLRTAKAESSRESGLTALAQAADAAPYRVVEGRLTGFAHKPRGAAALPREVVPAVLMARSPSDAVEARHADGVRRLLLGDVDRSIELLEQAAALNRADPAILNDLSVAYLERASRHGGARDLVDAFERSDHAARLDPTFTAAVFNRALAVERLGLRADAIEAWRRVRDSSPWRQEAADHVARLSAPTRRMLWDEVVERFDAAAARSDIKAVTALVELYPQQARVHFEEVLCGRWALAMSEGRQEAGERPGRAMRTVAMALRSVTGNEIPERTVEAIDAAAKDPRRVQQLVRGHVIYQRAIDSYRAVAITRAEPDFVESERLLRDARSPFAMLALFYRASSRSYENDITACLRLLEQAERELVAEGWEDSPAYGHVLWVRGRSLLKRGFPHASLECFLRALGVFAPSHELETLAALHDLLAYNFQFVGEDEKAWTHYVLAINLVEEAGANRRERVILHGAADYSMNRERPRTALLYITALVRLSIEGQDPGDHSRALLQRSRAHHILQNLRAAGDDLRDARTFAAQVIDPGLRDELDADLSAAEAEAGERGSANEELARFDRAIAVASRVEKELLLPRLWTARARASRRFDRIDDAERSLREGIAVIERHRGTVTDRDLQIAFAEQWYVAFDEMIDLLVDQRRYDEALSFAERSRGSVLFHELRPNADSDPSRWAPTIPDNHVLLEYVSLERSTILWLIRRDGVSCRRLPVDKKAIDRFVAASRAAIDGPAAGDDAARRELALLYDAIFRPVAKELRPGERLVFVPDKALQNVPFAALYDSVRGRWLVEDRAVAVAPSSRLFLAALDRDAALQRNPDRILTVGDPAFDAQRFPELPRLRAASLEAQQIARLYPEAKSLVGAEATPARFRAEANGASVVHIAAHALPNGRVPSWSALVFAPDPSQADAGVLYAFQINRSTFGETRLVVLAGCETASGRETRYEGTLGLARSFMAAGVPGVVSTLWRIDDETSRDLLLNFHRSLRAGDDAVTALRSAQLALIHGPDRAGRRVAVWAGFQVVGGVLPNA